MFCWGSRAVMVRCIELGLGMGSRWGTGTCPLLGVSPGVLLWPGVLQGTQEWGRGKALRISSPEHVLSLAHQKLRGTTHQKLPMDLLVLEDEKHHGASSLALQKVKVSARRIQCPHSGDRTGSYGLTPRSMVLEPAAQDPLGAC